MSSHIHKKLPCQLKHLIETFFFFTHLFPLSLKSGVHCTAPVQNGLPSPSGHPHPRGSYAPLPHIHLGNGLGPSWPSDLPHYSLLPGDCGNKPAVSGELNGNSGNLLTSFSARGSSAAKDCRNWVERTNQVMQGIINLCYFTHFKMLDLKNLVTVLYYSSLLFLN